MTRFTLRPLCGLLFVLATLLDTPVALAAEGGRPRIGVALSGGGARGAAHIGVLQVLESLRVPVDCITGTSMGAIIGGAYAAGITTEELEQVVVETDWGDVFNDQPPRQEQSIRRKADQLRGYSEIELGLQNGEVKAARGLVSGVQIESFLRRLTRPVADIEDFTRLPIPFRTVATDIETGEAVVLERGSLPQAMRASMAIPGLIAPVELNGALLVDGGIANNLPIELARQTCADVVIAVNIQSELFKRDQLNSAFSITGQLINLLGKTRVDAEIATLGAEDVLITPQLGAISSSSFDRQTEAVAIGRAAALELSAALSRYSLSETDYSLLRNTQMRHNTRLGKVAGIRFEGLERSNAAVLGDLMKSQPGQELSEEVLAADMRRIYGRGDFEGIDYRIAPDGDRRTLVVRPREKSWGPDYLGFGLGFASDFTGESQYSLMLQHRKTWINHLGAEWGNELQVGRRNRLSTEFYQPFDDTGRWFVRPGVALETYKQGLFFDHKQLATYAFEQASADIQLGYNIGTLGVLHGGLIWKWGTYRRDTGTFLLEEGSYDTRGLQATLLIDQLDRSRLATSGYALTVHAQRNRQQGSQNLDYRLLEARGLGVFNHGAHIIGLALQGGTSFGDELPGQELLQLGGPLRLSGYRIGEFQGQRYSLIRLDYRNRAVRLPAILGSGVFLGGSLESGRMDGLLNTTTGSGRVNSASIYLSADTAFGPAYLGLGLGDDGRRTLFLVLGTP